MKGTIPNVFSRTHDATRFSKCHAQIQRHQGNAGILRDKTMADKLINIPNDAQNYPFCRLKLMVATFKH